MRLKKKKALAGGELDEVRRLTAAGATRRAIGERLLATYHAVVAAQRLLGVYLTPEAWRDPTPDEIRQRADAIRQEWPPEVEARRRVTGPHGWEPTVVPVSIRRWIQ